MESFRCSKCWETKQGDGFGTGYGINDKKEKVCYSCCAITDRQTMIDKGNSKSLPLYFTGDKVTNWPSSLVFKPWGIKSGRHNMAGKRTDFWFAGPDGFVWHGYQIGQGNQIAHCSRTKTALD